MTKEMEVITIPIQNWCKKEQKWIPQKVFVVEEINNFGYEQYGEVVAAFTSFREASVFLINEGYEPTGELIDNEGYIGFERGEECLDEDRGFITELDLQGDLGNANSLLKGGS
ncbi:hypothetical protein ACI2JA_03285 [Alkalihalobacillus sp. NPDC078783]